MPYMTVVSDQLENMPMVESGYFESPEQIEVILFINTQYAKSVRQDLIAKLHREGYVEMTTYQGKGIQYTLRIMYTPNVSGHIRKEEQCKTSTS